MTPANPGDPPRGGADPTSRSVVDGFCELTIETSHPEALARFYLDAVGLVELDREGDRIWLGVGPTARLGIWSPGEKEFGDRGGRHVHFAFNVCADALDGLVSRLNDHGVSVQGPVRHDGGDRSISFDDPAGNRVEAWDVLARRDALPS